MHLRENLKNIDHDVVIGYRYMNIENNPATGKTKHRIGVSEG